MHHVDKSYSIHASSIIIICALMSLLWSKDLSSEYWE